MDTGRVTEEYPDCQQLQIPLVERGDLYFGITEGSHRLGGLELLAKLLSSRSLQGNMKL